jgi:lysozyme family protein
MSMKQHIADTAPGVTGATAASGLTLIGFITDSIPVLQAVSLVIGIAVAGVTFVYYWRKVRKAE